MTFSSHKDIGMEASSRSRAIAVARGDEPADLVLKGGQVLSVFTGEIFPADVAIVDGLVAGVGTYDAPDMIDVSGQYLIPGLIDGHCHIESSKLSVSEFARVVLATGTTGVVVDPHELANVLGVRGIEYVLEASQKVPLDVYVMIPSCVPASDFESPNKQLQAGDYIDLLAHPGVLGLAEMMNYPAVISGDASTLDKLSLFSWDQIDGHAPAVTGQDLNAYLAGGPRTDHECTTFSEALEKRRLGMWIMIREASMIRNLGALLPLVKEYGTENMLFVTDDREVDTLLHEGHMNAIVRVAVESGLSVGDAVKLASLNVARCHGLDRVGAIAPGYRADICVLSDLKSFVPTRVLKSGRVVFGRESAETIEPEPVPDFVRGTVNILPLNSESLHVATDHEAPDIRVVELIPDQVVTRTVVVPASTRDGLVVADPSRDVAKLVVVERHHATGRIGIGFVRGFGIRSGAFASTVAHDAHNIVVVGVNDGDMVRGIEHVQAIDGGLAVVADGRVLADLPLPIAGLMSDRPAEDVDRAMQQLEVTMSSLGVKLPTPFMYMGFLALSVIPELRVTDKGIVDVTAFELVSLVVESDAI